MLENSVRLGKIVAVSLAFEQCLDRALRGETHYGPYKIGPYRPCTGEPYATDPVATQVTQALASTRSPNALEYSCASGSDLSWGATTTLQDVGTSLERLTFNDRWLETIFPDWTAASEQSWHPYGWIALTVWHEVMHQHAYNHSSPAGCGQSSTYDMSFHSMPYITGSCINQVFLKSAAQCGDLNQCGPGAAPIVNGIDGTTCSCVNDPIPLVAPSITATPKPGLVRVSWPKVPGASSYRISSGLDGSTFQWSWTTFQCTAATCTSDDPQTWGNVYYSVVAMNGSVESPRSNVVAARGWSNVSHAPGVAAAQSSTYPDHSEASRAIDGSYDGNWNHGSVTATAWGWFDHWQIDLGSARSLKQIDLYCRTDWGCDYLQQFDIFTSSSACAWNNTCSWGSSRAYQATPAGSKTTLTLSGSYRYLQVRLRQRTDLGNPPPGAALMLAEVDIWGN